MMKIKNIEETKNSLIKTLVERVGRCCSNKPIYEITYIMGSKWIVCNSCYDLEEFQHGIKEKVRIKV